MSRVKKWSRIYFVYTVNFKSGYEIEGSGSDLLSQSFLFMKL